MEIYCSKFDMLLDIRAPLPSPTPRLWPLLFFLDSVVNEYSFKNNDKGGYNAGEKTQNKSTEWYHMVSSVN